MGNCLSGGTAESRAPVSSRASVASVKSASSSSSSSTFDDPLVLVDVPEPTPPVTDLYVLGRVLGRGAFGVTRVAKARSTGEQVAVKTITRRSIASHLPTHAERVRCEVEAMRRVAGHPHIISLKSAHEDAHGVHLAMELCSGGELFDAVSKRGAYTEKCAASLILTIARVIAHCHARGVIHRDLKPENLLLESSAPDAPLKAIDFGLAALVEPDGESDSVTAGGTGGGSARGLPNGNGTAAIDVAAAAAAAPAPLGGSARDGAAAAKLAPTPTPTPPLVPTSPSVAALEQQKPLTDICGSPLYIAPEVLRRHYGREADLWSLGVISYVLLTGRAPFDGRTERELFDQILHKSLDIRRDKEEPWPQISPGGKDFVSRLLERNPKRRLTARQALQHPWLVAIAAEKAAAGGYGAAAAAAAAKMEKCPKQLDVLKTMCNFAAAGAVRRRAAGVVAARAPPELIEALLPAFKKVDADDCGDGTVALGALPALLGCVDAGYAALRRGESADVAKAVVDEARRRAACRPCEKDKDDGKASTASKASSPPPSSCLPTPSPPTGTAKAVLDVYHEVMGHDGTQCACRVDYAVFLRAAADEARQLREQSLSAVLAKLDTKKTGELPRSRLEAATKNHCKAITQDVIDQALAAAREARASGGCCARKGRHKPTAATATATSSSTKGTEGDEVDKKAEKREGEDEEEEWVDYELFCAAIAKVCPKCSTTKQAARAA